jgi:hypothetical protein
MTFKTYLATVFCLVALYSTASANEITLSFSGSADCQDYEPCDPAFGVDLSFPVGDSFDGWGRVLQVIGPHGQSVSISGGSLYFWTEPSYDAQFFQPGPVSWDAWGDSAAGGGFSVGGSVFGSDPGTLLSGTFLWASWDIFHGMGADSAWLDSAIRVGYVNPALLQGFGLQPNLGFMGSLTGAYFEEDWRGSGDSRVGINLVATPEPSGMALGSLFLLVSGLAYLRRLRTRNCD